MGRPLTLSNRIAITIAITLVALFALFAGALYSEHQLLLTDRQEKVRNLVEVAHGVVADFDKAAKEGRMSEADAKKAALAAVRAMRYDKVEYFWINDMSPAIVMHAAKPELENKDMSQLKDPKGKLLFQEFVAVVKRDGAGLVDYYWPKPGSDTPVAKISYVKAYAPWGWIIGTGIYLDDVNAYFKKAALQLASGGVVILLLIGTSLLMLRRAVVGSLGGEPAHAVAITRQIAAGDMTGRIEVAPGDTTSLLAAVAGMQQNLRGMIAEVSADAGRVAQQAQEMQTAADQFTERFAAQSSSTQGIAAAVEQMSVGIDAIAHNAMEAHDFSVEAGTLATEGCRVIDETTADINGLAASVNASSERIRELEQHSKEISSIVNTIREIADQTNLLALNAAIEAARAGEQGRGFAVVADEVRKLAERTSLSTTEIANTVARIQDGTHIAVSSMDQGVEQASRGVEMSGKAGTAIASIRNGAQQVTTTLNQIAGAIREQSAAGQSIARSVEEIASITDRNFEDARRTAGTATELLALSEALRKSTSRFGV